MRRRSSAVAPRPSSFATCRPWARSRLTRTPRSSSRCRLAWSGRSWSPRAKGPASAREPRLTAGSARNGSGDGEDPDALTGGTGDERASDRRAPPPDARRPPSRSRRPARPNQTSPGPPRWSDAAAASRERSSRRASLLAADSASRVLIAPRRRRLDSTTHARAGLCCATRLCCRRQRRLPRAAARRGGCCVIRGLSEAVKTIAGMGRRFLECDRE